MGKVRLDALLVERGLAESRRSAEAMIMAGTVLIGADRGRKPGQTVDGAVELSIKPSPRFVSRGGLKLEAALNAFAINPKGAVALDIGASTGGFTDCLLQNGASRVYAVDVGRGQLHNRLLCDERVVSMERTNARGNYLLPEPVSIVVIDASFISLQLLIPPALDHLAEDGDLVCLIKPQFEAERNQVEPGGIVRAPEAILQVIERIVGWLPGVGLGAVGLVESPIHGAKGNREFLIHLKPGVPNAVSPAGAIRGVAASSHPVGSL